MTIISYFRKVFNLSSYKSKQFLWLVFKLSILVLLGYFIYHTLTNNSQISWSEFLLTLRNSDAFNLVNISILIAFTFVNWGLEILKWKILSSKIQATSYKEVAIQSLASHAFALITPNRIGEYGAKALYYPKEQRKNILILNFIGNFHQLIITLLLGFIGLLFWKSEIKEFIPELFYDFLTGTIIVVVFIISLLRIVSKKYRDWLEQVYKRFRFITTKLNLKISILCLLRYIVFAHQFYFLIALFNIEITYFICITSIAVMYFLSSIVPMLAIFDFVVKGSVAVFVFSYFEVPPLIILSITTFMWLLNFVLPAIIGSYFVLKFKPAAS